MLTKPLWLFTEQKVQDIIGHERWGLYAALLSLAFLVRPLGDLGLSQYITKQISADRERYPSLAGGALAVKLVLALVYLGGLVLIGWLLGYRGYALQILLLAGLLHTALNLLEIFRACLQAFQAFKLDGLASVLDKTLLMLIALGLLLTGGLSLTRFAVAAMSTMGLTMLFFGALVLRRYGRWQFRWPAGGAGPFLRRSFPFALIVILFSTNERLNQLMLERLASSQENGYYYAAYRWVGAIQMYLWTVLPVFYAKFARGATDSRERQQQLFNTGQAIVALPLLFAAGFLWFYGRKLFFLFDNSSPAELAYMTQNLQILGGMLLINGFFNIYSTYLTATGGERFVTRLLGAVIGLTALANLFLMPAFGALAASWTMTGAFGLLSLGYVAYFAQRTPLRPPWALLGKLALTAALFLGAFWALTLTGWPWWAVSATALGVLAGLTLLFRLIDWRAAVE